MVEEHSLCVDRDLTVSSFLSIGLLAKLGELRYNNKNLGDLNLYALLEEC